jgi:hypothetical protein
MTAVMSSDACFPRISDHACVSVVAAARGSAPVEIAGRATHDGVVFGVVFTAVPAGPHASVTGGPQ